MKSSIDEQASTVSFSVSTKIYPKDVLYKACYSFIDRMYIFLDISKKKDEIVVTLKGKTPLRKKGLGALEGEFVNELLNALVREKVSKRNRKVLEEIVGGAMGAALGVREMEGGDRKGLRDEVLGTGGVDDAEAKEIEAAVEALKLELAAIEAGDDYETDLLGIRTIMSDESACDSSGTGESCGSCGGCSTGTDDVPDEDAREIEAAVEALKRELAEIEIGEAVVAVSMPEKKSAKKPAKKVAAKKVAKKPVRKSTTKKNGHGTGNKR